uniref:CCHC-type domain-containing protein n=1 Tax=Xiphophorus maculatus TaxID=8083 RepID=A0A3B5RF72_XIPMA
RPHLHSLAPDPGTSPPQPSSQSDPAEPPHNTSLDHALIARHDSMLNALVDQQRSTNQRLEQLSDILTALHQRIVPADLPPVAAPPASFQTGVSAAPERAPPASARLREVSPPMPEPYTGEIDRCRGFLLQCSLVFSSSPQSFQTDGAKISFVVGNLRGRALKWAEARSAQHNLFHRTYDSFVLEFTQTFGYSESPADISRSLLSLKQGNQSVADFAIDFRTLAAASTWNAGALTGAFLQALNEDLKDELALRDEPGSLEELVALAIRIDNRIRDRARAKKEPSFAPRRTDFNPIPANQTGEEPMQIGRTRLPPEERQRRLRSGACLYCGQVGHYVANCPSLLKARARH